ncbi:hypothetical protein COCNU_13G002590 [Cocos nucifera]|uniref:Uncharacterized protein n=1 Tax=Cocos nucifera TaxID=13894 RepID=A0A8K0ISN2_COCNU|nr:hypothetical protein COCNU_13G002590 [Cocos nucifera]
MESIASLYAHCYRTNPKPNFFKGGGKERKKRTPNLTLDYEVLDGDGLTLE